MIKIVQSSDNNPPKNFRLFSLGDDTPKALFIIITFLAINKTKTCNLQVNKGFEHKPCATEN